MNICRQKKYFNPEVVYFTDRSKAVVLVLFLLCGFYNVAFQVESSLALCSHGFQSF